MPMPTRRRNARHDKPKKQARLLAPHRGSGEYELFHHLNHFGRLTAAWSAKEDPRDTEHPARR